MVTMGARLFMTSSRLKSTDSISSLPASILEKSKMSLMTPSRELADILILPK